MFCGLLGPYRRMWNDSLSGSPSKVLAQDFRCILRQGRVEPLAFVQGVGLGVMLGFRVAEAADGLGSGGEDLGAVLALYPPLGCHLGCRALNVLPPEGGP